MKRLLKRLRHRLMRRPIQIGPPIMMSARTSGKLLAIHFLMANTNERMPFNRDKLTGWD